MVDSFARSSTSKQDDNEERREPMQGNAYLIEAFAFSGRFEGGPFSRFSHVRSLQVLVRSSQHGDIRAGIFIPTSPIRVRTPSC